MVRQVLQWAGHFHLELCPSLCVLYWEMTLLFICAHLCPCVLVQEKSKRKTSIQPRGFPSCPLRGPGQQPAQTQLCHFLPHPPARPSTRPLSSASQMSSDSMHLSFHVTISNLGRPSFLAQVTTVDFRLASLTRFVYSHSSLFPNSLATWPEIFPKRESAYATSLLRYAVGPCCLADKTQTP